MYCYTPKALYNYVGSLLNHHQCAASTWMMRRLPQDNGASALTTHQLQVERRESRRANQVDGYYWEAMIVKGQRREFGPNTGDTPLLFYDECHGILNDHRESEPRFNIATERRYSFDSIVSPSLYWGIRTHADHRVSTPCWPYYHLYQLYELSCLYCCLCW